MGKSCAVYSDTSQTVLVANKISCSRRIFAQSFSNPKSTCEPKGDATVILDLCAGGTKSPEMAILDSAIIRTISASNSLSHNVGANRRALNLIDERPAYCASDARSMTTNSRINPISFFEWFAAREATERSASAARRQLRM